MKTNKGNRGDSHKASGFFLSVLAASILVWAGLSELAHARPEIQDEPVLRLRYQDSRPGSRETLVIGPADEENPVVPAAKKSPAVEPSPLPEAPPAPTLSAAPGGPCEYVSDPFFWNAHVGRLDAGTCAFCDPSTGCRRAFLHSASVGSYGGFDVVCGAEFARPGTTQADGSCKGEDTSPTETTPPKSPAPPANFGKPCEYISGPTVWSAVVPEIDAGTCTYCKKSENGCHSSVLTSSTKNADGGYNVTCQADFYRAGTIQMDGACR